MTEITSIVEQLTRRGDVQLVPKITMVIASPRFAGLFIWTQSYPEGEAFRFPILFHVIAHYL